MVSEYYVTEDTLILIPVDKNSTKIFDKNGVYIVEKNCFEIIDESCQYFGSSYSGRYIGAKRILNMEYKIPIILDEVKETILFPTCSPKLNNCIWICLNNIEKYEKGGKNSIIKFNNGLYHEVEISHNSLENQIFRSTLLLMKLKKRKNR